jgi:hypothetical protein
MAPAPGDLLCVPDLVEEAAARAGASPGHLPFTENLELLVSSSLRTGRLNGTGVKVLHKAALRHLRNLCYLQAYVDAHPDTPRRGLPGAVVVTGLPRTGTTLLHNLLSLDPATRFLRLWEALHPVPPGPDGPSVEALQAQAEGWLDAFYRIVPEFRAIHPATPSGPEECDALLQNTFASQHFDDMFDAEEYSAWFATAPMAGEYEHYALQLRALSAASPPGTRWALKSPSHLGHLDALLDALPGCRVLVCHRDPRQAVASYASLIFAVRRPYTDEASPAVVGRQALQRASTAMRRALEVRDRAGGAPFVDVSYPELSRDPVATVQALYRQLGRSLDGEVEERMRQWVGENPRHKHGAHRYDLARFGLAEAEVDAAFAPYVERFASALSP